MKKVMDSQKAWVQRVVLLQHDATRPTTSGAYEHHFPGVLKI